jgi:hypothetical protein
MHFKHLQSHQERIISLRLTVVSCGLWRPWRMCTQHSRFGGYDRPSMCLRDAEKANILCTLHEIRDFCSTYVHTIAADRLIHSPYHQGNVTALMLPISAMVIVIPGTSSPVREQASSLSHRTSCSNVFVDHTLCPKLQTPQMFISPKTRHQ